MTSLDLFGASPSTAPARPRTDRVSVQTGPRWADLCMEPASAPLPAGRLAPCELCEGHGLTRVLAPGPAEKWETCPRCEGRRSVYVLDAAGRVMGWGEEEGEALVRAQFAQAQEVARVA